MLKWELIEGFASQVKEMAKPKCQMPKSKCQMADALRAAIFGISCTELAKRLGKSQPAVSYAVRRGEKIAVGDKEFVSQTKARLSAKAVGRQISIEIQCDSSCGS